MAEIFSKMSILEVAKQVFNSMSIALFKHGFVVVKHAY